MLTLDCMQNFLSAAAEEFDICGQFAIDVRDEWQALRKPLLRALDLKLHHCAELGSIFPGTDDLFAHAKPAQIFERKINSSFGKIRAHILPEIRQLQGGACAIGKLLPLRIAVSAEVKHQVANWIRRIPAVAQQIVERVVAGDPLVLAESRQQIRKFIDRKSTRLNSSHLG